MNGGVAACACLGNRFGVCYTCCTSDAASPAPHATTYNLFSAHLNTTTSVVPEKWHTQSAQ